MPATAYKWQRHRARSESAEPPLPRLLYVLLLVGTSPHAVLPSTLSCLTVIGIVIFGALSGWSGAIDTVWDFFPVCSRSAKSHPTDVEVRTAESGLQRVREDLARDDRKTATREP
ncbi:hypothetical protein C8Q74DRAFT_1300604, partial [Fomes fomentarius]